MPTATMVGKDKVVPGGKVETVEAVFRVRTCEPAVSLAVLPATAVVLAVDGSRRHCDRLGVRVPAIS
jgi:hypothetical protein